MNKKTICKNRIHLILNEPSCDDCEERFDEIIDIIECEASKELRNRYAF